MGVCEGVGVADAVAVLVAVEEAVAELVGVAPAEAVAGADARALDEAGALPAPLPEGGALRVEEALPVGSRVGAPDCAPVLDAESVAVGKESAVVAGEAVAFLEAPAEALAGAEGDEEDEPRDAEAGAVAEAGADAPALGEPGALAAAEGLGARLAVSRAEVEAAAVAAPDAEGAAEEEGTGVLAVEGDPHSEAVAVGLAVSGAVAGADCEGGGGADSEAAADAVPVSSEVGASERDCVEVPLTRPVAVPSFAEAEPERDALVVGEGEPDAEGEPVTAAEREREARAVPLRATLGEPSGVSEGDGVEERRGETENAPEGDGWALVVAELRSVGAEEALPDGVLSPEGEPGGVRVTEGEGVSRATVEVSEGDAAGEREPEGLPVLEGDTRGEAVPESAAEPERLPEGDMEGVRDARGDAEAEAAIDAVDAALAERSVDGVAAEVRDAEAQPLAEGVSAEERETVDVREPVVVTLTTGEALDDIVLLPDTSEVRVGGAGEGLPDGVAARTVPEMEGEPVLVRDTVDEGESDEAPLPLREAEGLVEPVIPAEPVAADAVICEEGDTRMVVDPEGDLVGAKPVFEGDAETVATEALGVTETELDGDCVRDTTAEAVGAVDTVMSAEAVRALAVTVPVGLPEVAPEPENAVEVEGLDDAERGAEGEREEEGHMEGDAEDVPHTELLALPLGGAEPVKLTLGLDEPEGGRENVELALRLRSPELVAIALGETAAVRLWDTEITLVRVKFVTSVEDTVGEPVRGAERLGESDTVEETEAERLTEGELLGVGLVDCDAEREELNEEVAAAEAHAVDVLKMLAEGSTEAVMVEQGLPLRVRPAEPVRSAEADGGALVGDTVAVRALEGDTELLGDTVSLTEPLSDAVDLGEPVEATDSVPPMEGVIGALALRLAVPDNRAVNGAEGEIEDERQPVPDTVGVLEVEAQGEAEPIADPENDGEEQALLVTAALAVNWMLRDAEPEEASDAVRAPDVEGLTVPETETLADSVGAKDAVAAAEGEFESELGAEGDGETLLRAVPLPPADTEITPLTLGLPVGERVLVAERVIAVEAVATEGEGERVTRPLSVATLAVGGVVPLRDPVGETEADADTEGVLAPEGDTVPVAHPEEVTDTTPDAEGEPEREERPEGEKDALALPVTVPQRDAFDEGDRAAETDPANPEEAEGQPLLVPEVEGDRVSRPVTEGAPDCEALPDGLLTGEAEVLAVLKPDAVRQKVPDTVPLFAAETEKQPVPETDWDQLCVPEPVNVGWELSEALRDTLALPVIMDGVLVAVVHADAVKERVPLTVTVPRGLTEGDPE